jgi:3-oxoacyl-[acyl-carrier-protein] synthase II
VLLFEAPAVSRRDREEQSSLRVVVSGAAALGPGEAGSGEAATRQGAPSPPSGGSAPADRAIDALDPARSRRFDSLSALVTAVSESALDHAGLAPAGVGLAVGTPFGNVQRSVRFLQRLAQRGPRLVSPAEFPHLLPSSASGNASVYLGLTGPVLTVTDVGADAVAAFALAQRLVELGVAPAIVAGGVSLRDSVVARVLTPLFGEHTVPLGDGATCLILESAAHACARGARVLAEVAEVIHGRADAAHQLGRMRGPTGSRAAVVGMGPTQAVADALRRSRWARAECLDVRSLTGCEAGDSGAALLAGVAQIADSEADDVLVCVLAPGRVYAAHLARVAE